MFVLRIEGLAVFILAFLCPFSKISQYTLLCKAPL
ncbi:hypothetical protein [Brochothrix phage ADU4]|nr:hypothetical protein [Brochothrix phage ADU4]